MSALIVPLIQNIGISILQARNQMKFRSLLYVTIAIVCLIVQFPMAKQYGGIGCAITIAGSLALGHGIIMNIYYQHVQKIDILRFWKEIFRMSIVPILMTMIFYHVAAMYVIVSIPELILGIIVYSLLYLPLLYRFSMNKHEKDMLTNMLKHISKR